MRWITRAALFLLAVFLSPGPGEAQRFPPDEEINGILRRLVENGEAPGIVLGLLEADGTARVFTYGDPGPGSRPLGRASVFELASITKVFTGSLLAEMVAQGEVGLDDPVSRHLPDSVTVPSTPGRSITLLDLATHRSALPAIPTNYQPEDMTNPWAGFSLELLYEFLEGHELTRAPGELFEYSNVGFGLLGHALAHAAGTSYQELLEERILEPLGMNRTGYETPGAIDEWMVKGHGPSGEVVPFWFGSNAIAGAGGVTSTVDDLLLFVQAHVGAPRSQLDVALRDAHAVRSTIQEESPRAASGLGWQILFEGDRRIVTHGGTSGGFRTRIGFDPELAMGFVRLTNGRGFEYSIGLELLRRAAEEYPEAKDEM